MILLSLLVRVMPLMGLVPLVLMVLLLLVRKQRVWLNRLAHRAGEYHRRGIRVWLHLLAWWRLLLLLGPPLGGHSEAIWML